MANKQSGQAGVFVSHSHEDAADCRTLVGELRRSGENVWHYEHDVSPGTISKPIQDEIRARRNFLVLLSPAALAAPWVEAECHYAFELRRRDDRRTILPIVVKRVDVLDIWLCLQPYKRIEASSGEPLPERD